MMTINPFLAYACGLQAAETELGKTEWKGRNPSQEKFLLEYHSRYKHLAIRSFYSVSARASDLVTDLNQMLINNGFGEFEEPFTLWKGDFGIASFLNFPAIWHQFGQRGDLTIQSGQNYPCVVMTRSGHVRTYYSPVHPFPIIEIDLRQANLSLCLTDSRDLHSPDNLSQHIRDITESWHPQDLISEVRFPKIKLTKKIQVDFLRGLTVRSQQTGESYLQRFVVGLNFSWDEQGGPRMKQDDYSAQAALKREPFTIKNNLLFWLKSDELLSPLLSCQLSPDEWCQYNQKPLPSVSERF